MPEPAQGTIRHLAAAAKLEWERCPWQHSLQQHSALEAAGPADMSCRVMCAACLPRWLIKEQQLHREMGVARGAGVM